MANISKQNPDNSDLHNEYKKFRNDLTSALRNAQFEHHSKELDLTKHDVSKTWGVLRQIIGLTGPKVSKNLKFDYNNKIISDDTEIANAFNNFFASIGTELASKITSTLNPMTYISNIENSIFVPDVTENDVWNVIAQLKNSSAGWDHFPAIVAKQCINGYITPLTHVINLSLIQGVFPSELKLARVVPIYKNGDRQQITNYRPISVTSFFSKVFEKNYVQRFNKFSRRERCHFKVSIWFPEKTWNSTRHNNFS